MFGAEGVAYSQGALYVADVGRGPPNPSPITSP